MTPDWHPFIVHFALALPIVGSALYAAAYAAPSALPAAHWGLAIGVIFLWLAIGTGMGAALRVAPDTVARDAVALHQYWGWTTVVLYSASAALIITFGSRRWPTLCLLALAAASALVTGYLGAENVYRHGVGVDTATIESE